MSTPFIAELIRYADAEQESATDLAHIAQQLVSLEVVPGGPYASVSGGNGDLGVSIAAALVLARHGIRLPNVDAFITHHLTHGPRRSAVVRTTELSRLIERYGAIPSPKTIISSSTSVEDERMIKRICEAAYLRCNNLPDQFTTDAMRVIDRTIAQNSDRQMSLMAHYVRTALGESGKNFPDEYIVELGLANVFFWTAFIIYDDFWDEDEAAEPRLLPIANLFARHYTDFFSNRSPAFREFFTKTMDTLDAANQWETARCRMFRDGGVITIPNELPEYGDFGVKFHPAAGHVLGPVALLTDLGYELDSPEVRSLIEYFKHYLIAMQLNDDAHDWKEDLTRGHISTAVSLILQAWKRRYPDEQTIDIEQNMARLEQLFWFEVLEPLCERTLDRCKYSRKALASLTFIEDSTPLIAFIERNERIAHEALTDQRASVAFLAELSL